MEEHSIAKRVETPGMCASTANLDVDLHKITGDQRPEYCHQCGKCSSTCPVTDFLDFRPRRIVAMVQLGMIKDLLESEVIWECAQCLACKERCPRDVAPYDVIQALQNLVYSRNLSFPNGYTTLIGSILKGGVVSKPTRVRAWKNPLTRDTETKDFEYQDRESLNLPELKPLLGTEEFAKALRKTLKGEQK